MPYPTSVQTFATRNAGNTVEGEHVNTLQTEVNAVEDGLINGLQHRLIVSTGGLNVSTGNSTIGQNLSVIGTSTFVGLVTFPVPTVRVSHDADQNVANTAWTGLLWNRETYDAQGMHSTATNSSRLTFAHSTGVYHVGASVEWNANATGSRMIRLVINDSTNMAAAGMIGDGLPSGVAHPQSASGDWRVASTADYATVQVWQNNTSTGSISSGAGGHPLTFFAHKVSA